MQKIESDNHGKKEPGLLIHLPCKRRESKASRISGEKRLQILKEPESEEGLETEQLKARFIGNLLSSGVFIHPPVQLNGKMVWIVDKNGEYINTYESPKQVMRAIFLGEL